MTDQEFIELLRTRPAEINRLVNRVLPIKVGALAKAHFRENFRLSGFMNGGLQSWPATRRQQTGGKGATANYGPLLSKRNRLYGSIGYKPGPGYVVIGTTLPYASIHNDGGTVSPTVTLKMPWEEPEKKKTSRRPVSKEEDKKRFEALMKRMNGAG